MWDLGPNRDVVMDGATRASESAFDPWGREGRGGRAMKDDIDDYNFGGEGDAKNHSSQNSPSVL